MKIIYPPEFTYEELKAFKEKADRTKNANLIAKTTNQPNKILCFFSYKYFHDIIELNAEYLLNMYRG